MSRMAVCYFCGTVVDSPVPTPLLPASLRDGGDGPTIDLCADCEEKYGAVRETIAESVDGATTAPDAASAADPADTDAAADGLDDITIGDDDDTAESSADGEPDAGSDDAAFADVSVSKADFRRVMRLLENRDLPVERTEIETVASNAYDISETTCAAILDAAAERGHIAIADGRIVEAE